MLFGTGIDGALGPRLDTKDRLSASSPPLNAMLLVRRQKDHSSQSTMENFCYPSHQWCLDIHRLRYRARTLNLDHEVD